MAKPHRTLPELSAEEVAQFWNLIDKRAGQGPNGDCWMTATPAGHWRRGMIFARSRMAYFLTTGEDPGNLNCLHRCDERKCCNPAHLFLGTQADNMADAAAKGRTASGLRHRNYTHPESRPRGEGHGNAKLTEREAKEIIRLLNKGWTCTQISRHTGRPRTTISSIKIGHSWTHLPRD